MNIPLNIGRISIEDNSLCNPEAEISGQKSLQSQLTGVKAQLLGTGLVVTPEASSFVFEQGWKAPRLVRSGMSGGMEFFVHRDEYILALSCPYTVRAPQSGDITIQLVDNSLQLITESQQIGIVELLPEPSCYSKCTSSGTPMAMVAQQSFTKLAIGVYGACSLSSSAKTACTFCAIQSATPTDAKIKSDQDIIETVTAVYESDLSQNFETVMLGGGTPNSKDRGAARFSSLAKKITRITPWRVTVMMVPPENNDYLAMMHDAGVSEISINLEFGSENAFNRYVPGKAMLIGRHQYLDRLEAAVEIFGRYNVQSLLVTGLEQEEDTLQAVSWLSERGIIPVLSPFRPLKGTLLQDMKPSKVEDVVTTYRKSARIARKHGMFLGPRCIPCQCNTMSLPWDVPNSLPKH